MDDYPYDLGPYTRKITTASPAAQLWFDRGLNWCFGFHHEEAIHCFEAALAAGNYSSPQVLARVPQRA